MANETFAIDAGELARRLDGELQGLAHVSLSLKERMAIVTEVFAFARRVQEFLEPSGCSSDAKCEETTSMTNYTVRATIWAHVGDLIFPTTGPPTLRDTEPTQPVRERSAIFEMVNQKIGGGHFGGGSLKNLPDEELIALYANELSRRSGVELLVTARDARAADLLAELRALL